MPCWLAGHRFEITFVSHFRRWLEYYQLCKNCGKNEWFYVNKTGRHKGHRRG